MTSKLAGMVMQGFGDFLNELDAIKEGDGTLLDHSLVHGASATPATPRSTPSRTSRCSSPAAPAAGTRPASTSPTKGEPVTRVSLTAQQMVGAPVGEFGVGGMKTSRPITEVDGLRSERMRQAIGPPLLGRPGARRWRRPRPTPPGPRPTWSSGTSRPCTTAPRPASSIPAPTARRAPTPSSTGSRCWSTPATPAKRPPGCAIRPTRPAAPSTARTRWPSAARTGRTSTSNPTSTPDGGLVGVTGTIGEGIDLDGDREDRLRQPERREGHRQRLLQDPGLLEDLSRPAAPLQRRAAVQRRHARRLLDDRGGGDRRRARTR